MIEFRRQGGFQPPPDNEQLLIQDDGQFRLWRSVSRATHPPAPVGRFSGRLTPSQQDQLQTALALTIDADDYQPLILPDSAIDTLNVNGQRRAMLGHSHEPEAPWATLIVLLRGWLAALTHSPQQAIGLTVAADGQAAALDQLGPQLLAADFTDLAVHAVLWQDQWTNAGEWWAPPAMVPPHTGSTAAAWPVILPFFHGFHPAANQEVVAYVNFSVDGDDGPVPVALESSRRFLS